MQEKIMELLYKKFNNNLIKKTEDKFNFFNITIDKEILLDVLKLIKEELKFDRLVDIFCIDYKNEAERFEVIYHIHSLLNNFRIFIKTRTKDELPSAIKIYPGANWYEREVFDLFGVRFIGHNDLRRILLPSLYKDFPLRKDVHPLRPDNFNLSDQFSYRDIFSDIEEDELIINMGPQHPSTHGVLRLLVRLSGEEVIDLYPIIGYLHRGIEKLCESKKFSQIIPITDRLDYVSAALNNLAYVYAVEKLIDIEVPKRAEYIRTILAELNRIASHLLWLGTQGLDAGAFTPFLYTFREREKVLDIFEEYCGARMTLACIRIGGVKNDITKEFVKKTKEFVKDFYKRIDEYETLLTNNKIWLERAKGVGKLSKEIALGYGVTGPSLRACGVNFDLRKNEPYSIYNELEFKAAIQQEADVYSRYLVRIEELRQSNRIIAQAIDNIPEGKILSTESKFIFPDKAKLGDDLAALIHHSYLIVKGFKVKKREAYGAVESPRGELGFYIVANDDTSPYRLRIRAPSFANLQVLPEIFRRKGALLADVAVVIGSLDPCMGEVDR